MRLEALADAIASLNDYGNPESEAYKIRNPGMLKAESLHALDNVRDDCTRVFTLHQGGYRALLETLKKNPGRATVKDILSRMGHANQFALKDAVDFMQRSLGDKTVTANTTLEGLLE